MWKNIPNHPDYDINELGEVRSKKLNKERVLKPWYTKSGYAMISLRTDGVTHKYYIHRLVWETYKGKIPEGMFVLHGPGNDKSNTRLDYLRLGDFSDNMNDRARDGTSNRGERCGSAKLTEAQVIYIRQRCADGMSLSEASKLFGVSKASISDIKARRTWKHI